MENYSVYQDIANRTGGDIYIGVVGPVRTGKSTFIKRFMEQLVIPNAPEADRAVMTDELPQAGAGKTVMTTEPKFVPAKAVTISVAKGADVSVRLVDCVGFPVAGANGFEEDGKPRLVKTPWQDAPMPFERAGEIGTEKVIREHSTVGVLVTTDGSVTGLAREAYEKAEERAVAELRAIGKPFVILLNVQEPKNVQTLAETLENKYGVPVSAMNAETMSEKDICTLLQKALFEFPVTSIDIKLPAWLQTFPEDNSAVDAFICAVKKVAPHIQKMREASKLETLFDEQSDFINPDEIRMDLGTGKIALTVGVKEGLFYRVISEDCGEKIDGDLALMQYVRTLSATRKRCEKVATALAEAEQSGYGIVLPSEDEYTLKKPRLVKKSAGYCAEFNASATGYHILKVPVSGTVAPIIGTKTQGEDFIGEAVEAYEKGDVWETNILGKSLRELVLAELSGKSGAMPKELRAKLLKVTSRAVNDGKTNLFCILF